MALTRVVVAGGKCLDSGYSWMKELAGFPEELDVGAERKEVRMSVLSFWEMGRSRLGIH